MGKTVCINNIDLQPINRRNFCKYLSFRFLVHFIVLMCFCSRFVDPKKKRRRKKRKTKMLLNRLQPYTYIYTYLTSLIRKTMKLTSLVIHMFVAQRIYRTLKTSLSNPLPSEFRVIVFVFIKDSHLTISLRNKKKLEGLRRCLYRTAGIILSLNRNLFANEHLFQFLTFKLK